MSKFIILTLAFLMPLSSFAWMPQFQYYVTPQYAQVQVVNSTPYNAFCEGYVYGSTQTGHTVYSWFSSVVPAFGFQYAYVYANRPYMLVNAWTNIQCQY